MLWMNAGVYDESPLYTWVKTFSVPFLRKAAIRCIATIVYRFFFGQYHAALLGRIPVSRVDHQLDRKIPFVPAWIKIYLDFVPYWIRMLSFVLRKFGRRSYSQVREFIVSMGELYSYAAETYQKNLSTTDRPFYIVRPHFFFIHLLDPHLMCVPSLHVMVVIWTYVRFADMLRSLGAAEKYAVQIDEMKQGALAITEAILFVKQHSVNCIPAALYAMTRFNPRLFPPEEADSFIDRLFDSAPKACPYSPPKTKLRGEDIAAIKFHIRILYRQFLAARSSDWKEPILHFLQGMPGK